MRTFKTSSQIAPIINVGTYWGWFEYERLWTADEEAEREEGRFVCGDYDHAKLGEAIVETANEVFEAERPFEDYGVKAVRAEKFGSPREYNFMDDWLEMEFEVDESFFGLAETAIFDPKHRKDLEKYIERHWCSCDGFNSFMPCTVSNGKRYPEYRYEDPYLDEMHDIIRGLRDGTSDDEWRHFGAVIALLYVIELKEKRMMDDNDEFWGSLTGCLLEKFAGGRTLGDFCTILEPEEVAEKYPLAKALLDRADAGEKRLKEQLERYLKVDGIPEEARSRVEEEVKGRLAWIDGFRGDVREAVESFHPDYPDMVEKGLAEQEEEWTVRFGNDGDVAAKDLPGQMLLDLQEERT